MEMGNGLWVPRTGVAVVLTCLFACLPAHAQRPGDKPPPEVEAEVKALVPEVRRALAAKDEAAVCAAVARVREALGPYAGVPDAPEQHQTPVDTAEPSTELLVAEWGRLFKGPMAERGSRSEMARQNRMELREAAYIAIGCLALAESGAPDSEVYEARAREELDYLLPRQAEEGLFPFPADPAASAPNLVAMAERLRREHPEAIRDGYLVLNPDGGAQFDTGCCAYALVQGYRRLGDERYLAAARKAGDWAVRQEMVVNWNYNSFSVWQLAALYDATKERKYLDSALEKALVGVLPGLMDTGRWVDPHNARQAYHFIMVRALNELLRVLSRDHPRYDEIRRKTVLAADARARDILRDGVSNIESALAAYSRLLEDLEPRPLWKDAAAALANAAIATGWRGATSLPLYIRHRTR